ncbi:tRNA-specific adenosine deaminase [filamentous cyanobacterium CCP5]|nr:tRNA-specific adenosine deaminase [filamentous cyanobacterium CCP5]
MEDAREQYMEAAIALSFQAMREDRGGPYGAVVVKDGEIIGQGMNEVTSTNDPTAHAEMTAIRQACQKLGAWQLEGCELYTSCEPCPMCMAAVYWARLDTLFYGNTKEEAARYGFGSQTIYDELARSRADRKVSMVPLMKEEALAAFKEWQQKSDKQSY